MQGVIAVTDSEISVHLRAILIQMSASGMAKGYDSLADAIEKSDMWDFLFNMAEALACLHAFSVRDTKLIHKLMQRNL